MHEYYGPFNIQLLCSTIHYKIFSHMEYQTRWLEPFFLFSLEKRILFSKFSVYVLTACQLKRLACPVPSLLALWACFFSMLSRVFSVFLTRTYFPLFRRHQWFFCHPSSTGPSSVINGCFYSNICSFFIMIDSHLMLSHMILRFPLSKCMILCIVAIFCQLDICRRIISALSLNFFVRMCSLNLAIESWWSFDAFISGYFLHLRKDNFYNFRINININCCSVQNCSSLYPH